MTHKYRLYGIPCSLYTAKARSYLRKHAIEFIEFSPSDAHYTQAIVPHIGRVIMPVLETPEGSLIQDSADIIQHLEARFSTGPNSPVLQAISLLFELFGGEGLLRPAMHYRWNFDEQTLPTSLTALMAFIADDYLPEISAHIEFANHWMNVRRCPLAATVSTSPPSAPSVAPNLTGAAFA